MCRSNGGCMRSWLVVGLVGIAIGLPIIVFADQAGSDYLGAATCKKCHPTAFQVWEKSAHQRAHVALPEDRRNDTRCIQCHGSSANLNGGVQCESCHGTGKHYAKRYVMKDKELARIVGLVDVTEKTCRRCHTGSTPSIQPFEWKRLWLLVFHGLEKAKPEPATK